MMRFIKNLLLENWNLKTTALLLALILWLFVRGEPGAITVVDVPLEIQVPPSMEITNERPATIEVTMRGTALSKTWFGRQPLPSCIIDLQGAQEGEHVTSLTPDNIKVPAGSGIEVLQVNPTRITLVLERTISKEVPIVVPVLDEPPRGFEIYSKTSIPPSVVITGPRSHVDPVEEISTEAVSLSNLKESARFSVNLDFNSDSLRSSITGPVQVDVRIGPIRKLFTIAHVPVIPDDDSFAVTPKEISVQVLAPIESGGDIDAADFSAIVETENLDTSILPVKATPTVKLTERLDENVVIRDIKPSGVSVDKASQRKTK
jgi:YbbR domain-containing protein